MSWFGFKKKETMGTPDLCSLILNNQDIFFQLKKQVKGSKGNMIVVILPTLDHGENVCIKK